MFKKIQLICITSCLIISYLFFGLIGDSYAGSGQDGVSDPSVIINFHTKCTVEGEEVTVADIASVTCDDSSICQKVKSICIATLSAPGTTLRLSSDHVADVLRRTLPAIGISLSQVKGTVPVEIVVTRVKGTRARKVYAKIYREYVFKNMPWKKEDVNISDIKVSSTNFIPGENNITVKVVADSSLPFLGNTPLSVVLFRDGERVGSVRVVGKVNVFKPIAKAARNIKSREIISRDDIRFVRENLADLPHDVIVSPEEIIGKETAHSFRVNEVIRKRDIAEPLLVQKGDIVTIMISIPGLLITSKGQALEGGRLGQMMKVKNIATKRVVLGMVKGQKTVQVAF